MHNKSIKAIIGLGNPGSQYSLTRHNIGFRIVDALQEQYGGHWQSRDNMDITRIKIDDHAIILVKPTTFMNSSGNVLRWLMAQGIEPEEMLVVHDDLELPFGKISFKHGGSARGHNGVKSIIAAGGEKTFRLRFGIDRPVDKDLVPHYVLEKFKEDPAHIQQSIEQAIALLQDYLNAYSSQKQ